MPHVRTYRSCCLLVGLAVAVASYEGLQKLCLLVGLAVADASDEDLQELCLLVGLAVSDASNNDIASDEDICSFRPVS
jgi:hypothetical protein